MYISNMKSLTEKEAANLHETILDWIKCGGVKDVLKVVQAACEQSIDETVDVDELDRSPGYIASVSIGELVDHLETL